MEIVQETKTFFKKNYKEIITALTIVGLALLFYKQFSFEYEYQDIVNKKYNEQYESFKKQINEIQKINEERFQKQEALLKIYDDKIKTIDEQYKNSLTELVAKQKKLQSKIILDAQKDPTTLTEKILKTFNIKVTE